MSAEARPADVLVVGAGPVGLALACELRRHGVACRVVDKGDGPTPEDESRALAIHARTLELLERLDLAAALVAGGRRIRALSAWSDGRRLAKLELDFADLATPYPFVLAHAQGRTERLLLERLAALGGEVEWGTSLVDLRQDAGGVTAVLARAAEEAPAAAAHELRTPWLVGCDGAHSAVRHRLELSFDGAALEEEFLLADVRLEGDLAADEVHVLFARGGLVAAIPLGGAADRWRLIDTIGAPAAGREAMDFGVRFSARLAEAGVAASVREVGWTSTFRIHRRAVPRLRVGRVFLAGDAAHVHSPVGAQGMNTGIQDAFDLGWKLALAIDGGAADGLLDSYEAERLPVAHAVLRATDRATRLVTLRSPIARWVRARLVGVLAHSRRVRRQATRALSELGVGYRRSPIVGGDAGARPRPGERAGDAAPIEGPRGERRLFEVLAGTTKHVLLALEGEGAGRESALEEGCERVRARWGTRVAVLRVSARGDARPDAPEARLRDPAGAVHRVLGVQRASWVLVRPDGYVGFRGAAGDGTRLERALARVLRPGGREARRRA